MVHVIEHEKRFFFHAYTYIHTYLLFLFLDGKHFLNDYHPHAPIIPSEQMRNKSPVEMLSRYCKWGNEMPCRKRHSDSLDKA